MPNHLTPDEQRRLDQIEASLALLETEALPLKSEKATILNRARGRKHYAEKRANPASK